MAEEATNIENLRRIEILADWVVEAQLLRSAKNSDDFECLWVDAMRTDEVSVLRNIVSDGKNRAASVAECLRRNPTPAFLNIVAEMLESGAFANGWRESRKLSNQQIEYVVFREDVLALLREGYAENPVSERLLQRRASDVSRHLLNFSADEAKNAKIEYNDNLTDNTFLRWLISTRKILARSN